MVLDEEMSDIDVAGALTAGCTSILLQYDRAFVVLVNNVVIDGAVFHELECLMIQDNMDVACIRNSSSISLVCQGCVCMAWHGMANEE
jgi:hypothetical protein